MQRSRPHRFAVLLALLAALTHCRRLTGRHTHRANARAGYAPVTPLTTAIDLAPVAAVATLPTHHPADPPQYAAIGRLATQIAADARAGRRLLELAGRLRALRGRVLQARELLARSAEEEDAAIEGTADALAAAGLGPEGEAFRGRRHADFDRAMAARVLRAREPAAWEALLRTVGPLRDAARGTEAHQALEEQVNRTQGRVQRVALLRGVAAALPGETAVQSALAELDREGSPEALAGLARVADAALAALTGEQHGRFAAGLAGAAPLPDPGFGTGWTSWSVRSAREGLGAMAGSPQARLPAWALAPDPRLDAGVTHAGLAAALAALDLAIERVVGARPANALTPAMERDAALCRRPPAPRAADPRGAAQVVFDGRVVDLAAHAVVGAVPDTHSAVELEDDGELFRLCRDGVLSAYTAATGRPRWSVSTRAPCFGLWHDRERVYCLARSSLSVYDRADGRVATLFESRAPLIATALQLDGTSVLLLEDGALRFVRQADGALVRAVPAPAPPAQWTHLFSATAARLACVRRERAEDERVECYDAQGLERWAREVPTSEVTQRGGQSVRDRTLDFVRASRTHALYTTWWGTATRSLIFALEDGRVVADLTVRAAGMIERPDGGLEGVFSLEPGPAGPGRDLRLVLREPSGAERFRTPVGFDGDTAAALLHGGQLHVAVYSRIATTAAVVTVDARTGAPRWRYETGSVVRGHSEYSNAVALERVGGDLVVRGYESGGAYLVVLDAATGARRMQVLPPHCARRDACFGW